MKRLLPIVCFILTGVASSPVFGQYDSSLRRSFSIGVAALAIGDDSGIGFEIGTPSFLRDQLCLRVRGNILWLEAYKATCDHWARYKTMNVCAVYNLKMIERSRPYLEIGTTLIFPQQRISDTKMRQGWNCLAGAELFVADRPGFHVCYYFSGGFNGIYTYADKLENKPRYGNGFVFNNGFRFYF